MKPAIYTSLPGLSIVRTGGKEVELFIDPTTGGEPTGFNRIFHEERYGRMHFNCYAGDGFQLWKSEYAMHERISFSSLGDIGLLELHILLESGALNR